MKNLIYKWFKKFCINLVRDYSREVKNPSHKILVCYLSEPFFKKNNQKYLAAHQNRRETLMMASVFEKLGWSFRFTRLNKPLKRDICDFDIVFGCGPTFVEACNKNEKAIKIYYATGSYYAHQNKMIRHRTDEFNQKHQTSVAYNRLAKVQDSNEVADGIIQIGSKFTLETYPAQIRNKIQIIHQTSFDFSQIFEQKRKFKEYQNNQFIFMGSKGSILKGLDIVLDFFGIHQELTVHLFGYIDSDVADVYRKQLNECQNIINHGFTDISSPSFMEVAYKSPWIILPSVSEGCPGSVINCMKVGCIPLVTRFSACEEAEKVGFLMKAADVESLEEAVTSALELNKKEIEKRMTEAIQLATDNYNEATFIKEFKQAITEIADK